LQDADADAREQNRVGEDADDERTEGDDHLRAGALQRLGGGKVGGVALDQRRYRSPGGGRGGGCHRPLSYGVAATVGIAGGGDDAG